MEQAAVTDEPDFLDEIIAERGATTPDFAAMVDAAVEVRRLLRDLARRRQELRLSQRVIAARMGTTQSALARMESGEVDPRLSTVQRYVTALGDQLAHQPSANAPPASRRRATGVARAPGGASRPALAVPPPIGQA